MNTSKNFGTNHDHDGELLVMVPIALLTAIGLKQDELLQLIQKGHHHAPALKDYLSEEEAKKLLSKGKTWFFNMRNLCKLSGVKVGATRFYKMTEIQELFNNV